MDGAEVRYAHPGARWGTVLFGPLFAGAGLLLEYLTGPVRIWLWLAVAVLLTGSVALWVAGRRRMCAVRLTEQELRVGGETVPVHEIAAVHEDEVPDGARVLGGVWTVPRRFTEVPLRLVDGAVVLAWARDADRLRARLRELVPH